MPPRALGGDPGAGAGGARLERTHQVRDEILCAIREDRCEAVVLGCAGMADLTAWLSEETGIPVIDGVSVATRMIERWWARD